MILEALILFTIGVAVDVVNALYIKHVPHEAKKHRRSAAFFSVLMGAMGLIWRDIASGYLGLAWLFGLAIGTYYAIPWEKAITNFIEKYLTYEWKKSKKASSQGESDHTRSGTCSICKERGGHDCANAILHQRILQDPKEGL